MTAHENGEWPDAITWGNNMATHADLFTARQQDSGKMEMGFYNYKNALRALESKLNDRFPNETMLETEYLAAIACTSGALVEVGGPTGRYDSPLAPVAEIAAVGTRPVHIFNTIDAEGISAQADGGQLPLKGESVGLLVASCLPKDTRDRLFRESQRCLEPGGILAYQRANDLDVSYALRLGFSMLAYSRLPRSDLGEVFDPLTRVWTFVAQKPV